MTCLCGNEPRCTATIFSDSPRGFQMAALFSKSSSLGFPILILWRESHRLGCRHLDVKRRKGQMSRRNRSLAADLFVSLHQICQRYTCVFVGLCDLPSSNSPGHGGYFINKSAVQPPVFWENKNVYFLFFTLKLKKRNDTVYTKKQWHTHIK